MTKTTAWLADILVVNESPSEASPGDVWVFRGEGEACAYLEHWWVENDEGFAFTAAGQRVTFSVDERQNVVVIDREACPDGVEVVRCWLEASALFILAARRQKAAKRKAILSAFEERGQLPTSIEGLIAYIGFKD